jgi:hypothetical protein
MSKSFIWLLIISTAIAVPAGCYIMDKVIFGKLVYRAPISVVDAGLGALVVIVIALLMIVWQTSIVARTNPASVLKSE